MCCIGLTERGDREVLREGGKDEGREGEVQRETERAL